MTPLEELQAAHKRLSELRESVGPHDWIVDFVGEHIDSSRANLVTLLRRTIGAQLTTLGSVIAEYAATDVPWGRGDEPAASERALELARAINGEA